MDDGTYEEKPLVSQELKLHNRIVEYILGHKNIDYRLVDFT
jgi:hypothetical protein